jgi:hypothetical protein
MHSVDPAVEEIRHRPKHAVDPYEAGGPAVPVTMMPTGR